MNEIDRLKAEIQRLKKLLADVRKSGTMLEMEPPMVAIPRALWIACCKEGEAL